MNLKAKLAEEFSIDLGSTKKILGLRISRERKRSLKISQVEYVEVLKRFNMSDAKPVNIMLGGHFKLSKHRFRRHKMRMLSCRRCHMHQLWEA